MRCSDKERDSKSSSQSSTDYVGNAKLIYNSSTPIIKGCREETPGLIVPTSVIVKRIALLSQLPENDLRRLIESYDDSNVGGLSEAQWARFCHENRKHMSSLGEEILDFDRPDDYCIVAAERPDSVTDKESTSFTRGMVRFLEAFAAGGIAGAVSKTLIAPGDRIKIIFQVEPSRQFSLRQAFYLGVETVREFGVMGLWIGNGATMLRVVPYAAITFVSYDYYQSFFFSLQRNDASHSIDEGRAVAVRFLCGALSGATSTVFTYPLDLMRARFAAHSSSGKTRFPSYRQAFREAISKHGFFSLYSGLLPTLVGIMPYMGCTFACFETIKHYILWISHLESDKLIPAWQLFIAGAFSGLIAQSATYPLDIVRRRMQVAPGRYKGIGQAFQTIFREEGLRRGMYKGLSMNWIKGPIATATSFTVKDLIKRRTRTYYETAAEFSQRKTLVTLPEAFVCGGVAAGVARFWMIPFDNIKIMYQLGIADQEKGVWRGFKNLCRMLHRNPNMWTSANVTMMRTVPYGALTYSLFDVFQSIFERLTYTHQSTSLSNFFAGASAAAVSMFFVYPLDLLRTRSNAAGSRFQSYFWFFWVMAKRHGISSLYENCRLAMLGMGLLAGTGFATYEYLKERFQCQSLKYRLAAGVSAGLVAQTFIYPLNVAKRASQAKYLMYTSVLKTQSPLFLNPARYSAFSYKMPFSCLLNSLIFGISFAVNDACRDLAVAARTDIFRDIVFLSQPTKNTGSTSQ